MKSLSYNAVSLLLWLKDEAIDINSYQKYPSDIDPQYYLPMSFRDQQKAIDELNKQNIIQTKIIDGCLFYLMVETFNHELLSQLDIYNSSQKSELYLSDSNKPRTDQKLSKFNTL